MENSDNENEVENAINNEIIETIETTFDATGMWGIFPCRIRMPGGRPEIVMMGRNVTVGEINAQLEGAFGFSTYYLGMWVEGDVLPISADKTLGDLDGTDFAIGMANQEWDDGVEYQPKDRGFLNAVIKQISKDENMTTYRCEDFPIEIGLLRTTKDTYNEYAPSGTILSAIETYQTIVTIIE